MRRFATIVAVAVVVGALFLMVPARAQQPASAQPAPDGLIVVDAVVTDRDGRPVTDLARGDFRVEDNGKAVQLESFAAVSADGSSPEQARSIMVLLDDAGVPSSGTHALQVIAQNLLSKMGPGDDIGILRLHDSADEVATEPDRALNVINTFAAGAFPFVSTETPEDTLELVAALARKMGGASDGASSAARNRRKAFVCIGSPAVCAMPEVPSTASRGLYPAWQATVDAVADANVAVYSIIPAQTQVRVSTLSGVSGGEIFATTSAFGEAIDRIWSDLSHYYLLGYRPADGSRDLPSVSVRTNRRGVEVRARTRRGK